MRLDVFDESNRKRPAPAEPTDGLDPTKRQRLGATVPSSTPPIPPLPPGPVSYRQLFTLNPDGNTVGFDVQMFKDPEQLLRILVPILQSIDEAKLGNAINVRGDLRAENKWLVNCGGSQSRCPVGYASSRDAPHMDRLLGSGVLDASH